MIGISNHKIDCHSEETKNLHKVKHEIRISKIETISNVKNSNIQTDCHSEETKNLPNNYHETT